MILAQRRCELRFEMRSNLPRLLRTAGSTVLYVTQDYKEADGSRRPYAVLEMEASSGRHAGRDLCEPRHWQSPPGSAINHHVAEATISASGLMASIA